MDRLRFVCVTAISVVFAALPLCQDAAIPRATAVCGYAEKYDVRIYNPTETGVKVKSRRNDEGVLVAAQLVSPASLCRHGVSARVW